MDKLRQDMLKKLERERELNENRAGDNQHDESSAENDAGNKKHGSKRNTDNNIAEEEENQDFNMFDSVHVEKMTTEKTLHGQGQDQVYDDLECDDKERYLKIRIGELIKDQYRVVQKLGKGVFANVVKALDVKNNKEYAIKILRNDEIMMRAGEKEKNILEALNA